MYEDVAFTGWSSLGDKTLCLTFDDGPGQTDASERGPHTIEIARYLNEQGIRATFFMVGKFASELTGVMRDVHELGHLIGNHTHDHVSLVDYAAVNGDVVFQVSRTDSLVRSWIDGSIVFFRPPYGEWTPSLARTLNADLAVSLSHVGPINWDIAGWDWSYWQQGLDPSECAESYMQAIENKGGKGIVLMHDCSADIEQVRLANRTFEAIQILIPELRQQGYKFVRLDEIPAIAARAQNSLRIALKGSNGLYISPQGGGGSWVFVDGPTIGAWEPIVVEDVSSGKVTLQVANGNYISPQGGGGGPVLANGPAVQSWERMELLSLGSNRVAFRCSSGNFLTFHGVGGTPVLTAAKSAFPANKIFTFEYLP